MQGFDYRSPRWRRLRADVLREAGYRCQYSRRFGKRVEASHVHHRWNLIALSQEAHNKMHDRTTGELSAIGENLRRRTVPPGNGGTRT